ncbi:MAG: VOC family protein [Anderseniella sp.]
MAVIQTQGVHHITLNGADRQTSIDFWEGILGMPFVFEQPNLDAPDTNHLYFDPGDGRLITIFTNEDWLVDATPNPNDVGNLHHLAFIVSRATYTQAAERLEAAGVSNSGNVDRGFMDSLYFRDPLGQLMELACYKFDPPHGCTHADVLHRAHKIRVKAKDYNITDKHIADALVVLVQKSAGTLSDQGSNGA